MQINNNTVYNCRVHPFNWWHEVGCPHENWTLSELESALNNIQPKSGWKYTQLKKQIRKKLKMLKGV